MSNKKSERGFTDYFISTTNARRIKLMLKEPDVMYTPAGKKIVKKEGITIEFRNGRYEPRTEEERELLLELCKTKKYIRLFSSKEQEKLSEIEKAKSKAEEEVRKKYEEPDAS